MFIGAAARRPPVRCGSGAADDHRPGLAAGGFHHPASLTTVHRWPWCWSARPAGLRHRRRLGRHHRLRRRCGTGRAGRCDVESARNLQRVRRRFGIAISWAVCPTRSTGCPSTTPFRRHPRRSQPVRVIATAHGLEAEQAQHLMAVARSSFVDGLSAAAGWRRGVARHGGARGVGIAGTVRTCRVRGACGSRIGTCRGGTDSGPDPSGRGRRACQEGFPNQQS